MVLTIRSVRRTLPYAVLALLSGCSSTNGGATEPGDGGAEAAKTLDAEAHDATPGSDAKGAREGGEKDATHEDAGGNDATPKDTGSDTLAPDGAHDSALGDDGGDAAPHAGPAAVNLGTAGDYVVLAMSAITNAPTSAITGDLGLSPAAASYITGFSMTRAGTMWTSAQVTGAIFAADNDPPTPVNLGVAVGDMMTAYTDAAGRPTPDFLNDAAGAIGGLTLAPGLYKWTSAVTIASDLVLAGAANDTWLFQVAGDLSIAAAQKVTLSGGAMAKNVVWQVAGSVDFGATSHAEGVVLGKNGITLETGASLNGRLLAQTAVSLAGDVISAPAQ